MGAPKRLPHGSCYPAVSGLHEDMLTGPDGVPKVSRALRARAAVFSFEFDSARHYFLVNFASGLQNCPEFSSRFRCFKIAHLALQTYSKFSSRSSTFKLHIQLSKHTFRPSPSIRSIYFLSSFRRSTYLFVPARHHAPLVDAEGATPSNILLKTPKLIAPTS